MSVRLQAWIRQAEDDLAMARHARSGGFFAQACFASSQAAEKALKGLLLGLGVEPPRSHSLERLVDALAEAGLPVDRFRMLQLKPLSRMVTSTRYPDGDEAPADLFDARDCDQALDISGAVLALVREAIQADGTPLSPPGSP